jgi:hypothetical protein
VLGARMWRSKRTSLACTPATVGLGKGASSYRWVGRRLNIILTPLLCSILQLWYVIVQVGLVIFMSVLWMSNLEPKITTGACELTLAIDACGIMLIESGISDVGR